MWREWVLLKMVVSFFLSSSTVYPAVKVQKALYHVDSWKWKLLSCVQLFVTPWTIQWNSPGQNTVVGSLSFLQGVFPTQGSNPGLPHCILYQLSHKGSPSILEWVAYPFSSRSSQPRNQTRVSCITGGFFTSWATREAHRTIEIILFTVVEARSPRSNY